MWLWWEGIPIGDLFDVIEDTDDPKNHVDP